MTTAKTDALERRAQELTLRDRTHLRLTGVEDVIRADEQELALSTSLGRLTVQGEDLKICRFSQDSGELEVEGQTDALIYSAEGSEKGFWARLFG